MIRNIAYQHTFTKEVIHANELPDMHWTEKAFWEKFVQLNLDEPEHDFDSWEWKLDRFIPGDVLVFKFNYDDYVRDD